VSYQRYWVEVEQNDTRDKFEWGSDNGRGFRQAIGGFWISVNQYRNTLQVIEHGVAKYLTTHGNSENTGNCHPINMENICKPWFWVVFVGITIQSTADNIWDCQDVHNKWITIYSEYSSWIFILVIFNIQLYKLTCSSLSNIVHHNSKHH